MAELYIRWVKGLSKRREVCVIARLLKVSPREAAAMCMEVWEWADEETTDGTIPGAVPGDIDRIVNVPGLSLALMAQNVDWLRADAHGITFPRWDKNNGNSAKKREYERRKKQSQRKLGKKRLSRKCPRNVPEKNGDNKGAPLISTLPLPLSLKKEEFETAISEWLAYKQGRRESYTEQGLRAMVSRAANLTAEHGMRAVIDAMERAMANNWAGWDQRGSFEKNGRNGSSAADPRGNLAAAKRYLEAKEAENG